MSTPRWPEPYLVAGGWYFRTMSFALGKGSESAGGGVGGMFSRGVHLAVWQNKRSRAKAANTPKSSVLVKKIIGLTSSGRQLVEELLPLVNLILVLLSSWCRITKCCWALGAG